MKNAGAPPLLLRCALLLALGLATAAAYAPAFKAGFVYDDFRFIVANPRLDRPLDLRSLFLDKNGALPDKEPDIYRPLGTLVFYGERKIGGGTPFVHHLTSVLLHAANVWLLFFLLARLLGAAREGARPFWPALLGAGLFALHPLQVETVAWISSRCGEMSAFFILLALLAALRPAGGSARRRFFLPLSAIVRGMGILILTALACLSKESGVVTGALILSAWFCLPPFRRKDVFFAGIVSLAAAGLYMALRIHVLGPGLDQVSPHGGTRLTGFFYGAFGCLYQLGLLFRPAFHNLDYQSGFFADLPFLLVAACAVFYLLIAAAAFPLRRRFPLISLGILMTAAAQFPTSSMFVTLRSLVNDRYLYMPLAGVALVFAALLARSARSAPPLRFLFRGAGAALLLLLASFTYGRAADWVDSKSLWKAAIATNSGSVSARAGLARAYLEEGRPGKALETAVEGFERGAFGTIGRMNAMYQAAKALQELKRFDRAGDLFERLLDEAESSGHGGDFRFFDKACLGLYLARVKADRYGDAAAAAERLIAGSGKTAAHLDLLGLALFGAGRTGEAEKVFREGASLPGDFPEIHYHLAALYVKSGRKEQAQKEIAEGRREEKRRGPSEWTEGFEKIGKILDTIGNEDRLKKGGPK